VLVLAFPVVTLHRWDLTCHVDLGRVVDPYGSLEDPTIQRWYSWCKRRPHVGNMDRFRPHVESLMISKNKLTEWSTEYQQSIKEIKHRLNKDAQAK